MTAQHIDPKARVWTVTLGNDGRLHAAVDIARLKRTLREAEPLAA